MKIAIVGSRKYETKRKIKDFIFRIKEKYGEDITIVFSTFELLEWLDIKYLKKQLIKHIKEL